LISRRESHDLKWRSHDNIARDKTNFDAFEKDEGNSVDPPEDEGLLLKIFQFRRSHL